MKKRDKIIYWVATVWLSLGMVSTGLVQLMHMEEEVVKMTALGYQTYVLTLIGIWKLLGVIAILVPKFPLLKEWAYAGFTILMTGAIVSHLSVGDELVELIGPTLLLILTLLSWKFKSIRNSETQTR